MSGGGTMAFTDILTATRDAAYDGLSVKPSFKVISPGSEVAWDECCEGMLYVRLGESTPRYQRGNQARCPITLDLILRVGVLRCVTNLGDGGRLPSSREITRDGLVTARDMGELYNALQCFEAPGAMSTSLGTWSPLGPQGDCAGGEWQLNVRMGVPLTWA